MKTLEFVPAFVTWDVANVRHYSQLVCSHQSHLDSSAIRVFVTILQERIYWQTQLS